MSPGTGLAVDTEVAQLSVQPNPSGPGVPDWVCCCASSASYVRENASGGPNVGILRSVTDWLKSPFSVSTGSPADACDKPGSAAFDPPIAVPAGTSPPADGAKAAVPLLTGAPASTYGSPGTPSDAVKSA